MLTNTSSSTINSWLNRATSRLEKASIPTSRLDALVLLSDVLNKDKSYLLAHSDQILPQRTVRTLNRQIARRTNHEPLAYIRGKSEFYGREFLVNRHTLQPRPETETMIDLLLKTLKSQKPPLQKVRPFTERKNVNRGIIDVGTGSGCIAITVKLEIPEFDVMGIDISKQCLNVSQKNANKLDANVAFLHGNLLDPFRKIGYKNFYSVLANLPYVPDSHTVNADAMQEPKIAIFGGKDGLDLYRNLFEQISVLKHKPIYTFTESLPTQHRELQKIAQSAGYKLTTSDDFIQVFRLD